MLVLSGPHGFMIFPNFLMTSNPLPALAWAALLPARAKEGDRKRRQFRDEGSNGFFRTGYLILLQRKASMPFST